MHIVLFNAPLKGQTTFRINRFIRILLAFPALYVTTHARHFNVVLTWIPLPPPFLEMFPVESRKHENKKVAILNGQYSIYLLSGTWTLFGGHQVDPWWYLYNGIGGCSGKGFELQAWVCVCVCVFA